jgi:hypothetical protein
MTHDWTVSPSTGVGAAFGTDDRLSKAVPKRTIGVAIKEAPANRW